MNIKPVPAFIPKFNEGDKSHESGRSLTSSLHDLSLIPKDVDMPAPVSMDTNPYEVSLSGRHTDHVTSGLSAKEQMIQSIEAWREANRDAGCEPADIEGIYQFFCKNLEDDGSIHIPSRTENFLKGKDFISLPDNLRINVVRGRYELDLCGCKNLKCLPKGLEVNILQIRRCQNLEEDFIANEITVSQLTISEIQNIRKLTLKVKGINYLDVFDCKQLVSIDCSCANESMIESVDLRDCPRLESFTSQHLKRIGLLLAMKCPLLKQLPDTIHYEDMELFRCGVKHCPASTHPIETLSISDMPISEGFFRNKVTVKLLKLKSCDEIEYIPDNVEVKEAIFLQYCRELKAINVSARMLLRVTVRSCSKLQEFLPYIREIKTHLRLTDCRALEKLPANLRKVGLLEISACPQLKVTLDKSRIDKLNIVDCFKVFYDDEDGSDYASEPELPYP